MRIFLYVITLFITHHIVSLIQASLHCLLGHRAVGGTIYETHLYNHHGIYSSNILVSDTYLDETESLDLYYAIPGILVALCAYWALPYDLFVVHIAGLALSTAAHLYLHTQYHLRQSWLARFPWFAKKQRLHLIHHKDMTKNFAVVEFFWDRVLGTYEEARVPVEV